MVLLLFLTVPALAEEALAFDGNLRIEDGTLLPCALIPTPGTPRTAMKTATYCGSACTWRPITTPTTTAGGPGEGHGAGAAGRCRRKDKAATIYDPTPYGAGTYDGAYTFPETMFDPVPFDYDSLYRECGKRTPAGEMSTLDCAMAARPDKDWNYAVPQSGQPGYSYLSVYDYYLLPGQGLCRGGGQRYRHLRLRGL